MDLSKYMGSPATVAKVTSSAAATGTITVTGKAGLSIYVYGFTISCSAAPAATVQVALKDGTTVIVPIELPASAIQPFNADFDNHPIQITAGNDCVLTCPSLGGSGVSSLSLRYGFGTP